VFALSSSASQSIFVSLEYNPCRLSATEPEQLSVAESIRSQILVGRFGEPVEIAKAIVFLASDESSYTVGSELIIDGGMSNL